MPDLGSFLAGAKQSKTSGPTTGFVRPSDTTQGHAGPAPLAPQGEFPVTPIFSQLPGATNKLAQRYAPTSPYADALSPQTFNAMKAFESERVGRGQAALSAPVARAVGVSAETGKAVTPQKEEGGIGGFLSNIGSDITAIGSALINVPNLVGSIVEEGEMLSTQREDGETETVKVLLEYAKDHPEEVTGWEGSPGTSRPYFTNRGSVGAFSKFPGVRFLPGAFTLGSIISGNYEELAKHPLFATLDVLPYASKAASLTPAAKAGRVAQVAEAERLAATLGIPQRAARAQPIRSALFKKAVTDSTVEANVLGRAASAAGDFLKQTKGIKSATDLADQAWSSTSRSWASTVFEREMELKHALDPSSPYRIADTEAAWAKEVNSLADNYNLAPDRRIALGDDLMHGRTPGILDDNELAWTQSVKDLTNRGKVLYSDPAIMGPNALTDRMWFGTEETFTKNVARKFDGWEKQETKYAKNLAEKDSLTATLQSFSDPLHPLAASDNTFHIFDELGKRENLINQPGSQLFRKSLQNGDYATASKTLKSFRSNEKWADITPYKDAAVAELKVAAKAQDELFKIKSFTPKGYETLKTKLDSKRAGYVPERFGAVKDTLISSKLKETISADDFRIAAGLDDVGLQNWIKFVDNGNYPALVSAIGETGAAKMFAKSQRSILKEVGEQVLEMKKVGLDPVFMHRVQPNKANQVLSLSRFEPPVSALKARKLDLTPYVPDFQVSLSSQAMDLLRNQTWQELHQNMVSGFGTSYDTLYNRLLPKAEAAQAKNPGLNVRSYIDKEISKLGFAKYEAAETFAPFVKGLNDTYVPKIINQNFARNAAQRSPFGAIFDGYNNAFRVSVLALSPRNLVNNVFGGSVFALLESDPLLFKHFRTAHKFVTKGEMDQVPGLRGHGTLGSAVSKADIDSIVSKMTDPQKMVALQEYRSGRFLKRLVGESSKLVSGSYKLNSYVDDMYRSMVYLREAEKAGGVLSKAGRDKGLAVARRVMMNFDEITPIERTVIRNIIPFYTFQQHVMRFALRYPFDHPVRSQILGTFTRREMEDRQDGLPLQMLGLLNFGAESEDGKQSAIDLGAGNPFRDTNKLFTLAGWMGSTHPVISAISQTFGYDPVAGGGDIYADVEVDPETGKLVAAQKGFLGRAIAPIVPFGRLFEDLLTNKQVFNELLRTNPEAARQRLISDLQLPKILKTVDPKREQIKSELNRQRVLQETKSEALKTGQYDAAAAQYPALSAYFSQLGGQVKAGKLDENVAAPAPVLNPAQLLLQGAPTITVPTSPRPVSGAPQGAAPPAPPAPSAVAAYNQQIRPN